MARVSVVMPSYNHARFIGDAIASILAQTMSDLELIVVDDGSSDKSNDIIAAIKDPRLTHIPLKKNIGACAAFDLALGMCNGEFIALCNSDDLWVSDKLDRQLAQFNGRPEIGVVFSDVICIDEDGANIKENKRPPYADIFKQANRSRIEWMRTLIEQGNCLCHPSMMIRREVYNKVGTYDNLLRQLPDHELWLRVVQFYNIHVMPDQLVMFRVHQNNTSRPSPANVQRIYRERILLTKRFFRDVSLENFHAAFMPVDAPVPQTAADFLRAKVSYMVQANCGLRAELLEMAIDTVYYGSIEYGEEIISAREFQTLTAQAVPQLAWSTMKYRLRSNFERLAGPRISNTIANTFIRMKKHRQKKARS